MDSSDSHVLMIVRTGQNTNPYNVFANERNDTGSSSEPPHTDPLNPFRNWNQLTIDTNTDNDWRRQQHFQRQRMQLLSMAMLLCFMVLLLDNRGTPQTHASDTNASDNAFPMENTYAHKPITEPYPKMKMSQILSFLELLKEQPNYSEKNNISSISGVYSGQWKVSNADRYRQQRSNATDIIPYLRVDHEIQSQHYAQAPSETGLVWLFLKMKAPATKEIIDQVHYVTGQLVIYEEKTSFAGTIMPVQGVYIQNLGQLTLFGNSPDSSVHLLYKSDKPSKQTSSNATHETLLSELNTKKNALGIPAVHTQMYDSLGISPPRYAYASRFRSSDAFSDQCISVIQLSVTGNASSAKLNGTLASENCGLYLSLDIHFRKKNLDRFFAKASHYAMLMLLISAAEIYFILRQLQASSTQATAAKVSLLTIGQQAIMDSYLCLAHLTVGIIAQNVFTAFASVAFIKLIIFSVFEMRYLLIIWKARRPQGFSEGWVTLRRELATLYSRFYLSLLLGLVVFYNFSRFLPLLIFLFYSFWVPQIVHNAHRQIRSPFHAGYLYGMTLLRMFLPLYFYGCPHNFLSEFPMLETRLSPIYCLWLSAWMGLQVIFLLLQQKIGPQFFIPARFLPVKYNYERRLESHEVVSLLADGESESLDCVICMVELELEGKEYMIAPCDHIFHSECLKNWMQVKMECPTCRCVLPEP